MRRERGLRRVNDRNGRTCAPTLRKRGPTARYLRPMLRGDETWCQLFSEPGAGSDLANLATRARREGDEFVVNGQKVWTSNAHLCDFAILLARTNVDVPKHRGISLLLLDLRTPGVEIRPLRQITGACHFNEVFLTDARVPVENVVGDIDSGWTVARAVLAHEASVIGGGNPAATGCAELDRARARGSIAPKIPCSVSGLRRRTRVSGFSNT